MAVGWCDLVPVASPPIATRVDTLAYQDSRVAASEWRSIRVRLLICTYDAPPCGVRLHKLTGQTTNYPPSRLLGYRCSSDHQVGELGHLLRQAP